MDPLGAGFGASACDTLVVEEAAGKPAEVDLTEM